MTTYRRWSEEERELVRKGYRNNWQSLVELADQLGRSAYGVRGQVGKLRLTKPHRRWQPEELEYLAENYGRISDQVLCRRLKRTRVAILLATKRHLNGVTKRNNIYTAHEVARLLGVPCSKTVIEWYRKGFIKGRRAPWKQGHNFVWFFDYEDIEKFVCRYPWLPHFENMETSFFRTIVLEEKERDPWFTCEQVAKMLGLADYNPIHRYIHWGMLKAIWKPGGTGHHEWVIRQSAIDAFLNRDPRAKHRREALMNSRRQLQYRRHNPIKLLAIWAIRCPKCHRKVRLRTDPNLTGPELKVLFLSLYTGERCSHGRVCEVIKETAGER